ncbi:MAG: hypothetical protein EB121_04125, partial [Alphaproteobacteria bacterium]|nr:hypothetical protein [Alphaproteobacteria bacterium]
MVFSVSDAVSAYSKAGNLPSVSGIAKGGQAGGFDDMLKSMVDDTVDSLQAGEKATLMAAQG